MHINKLLITKTLNPFYKINKCTIQRIRQTKSIEIARKKVFINFVLGCS